MIVAPLLTIIFISVLVTLFFLFFRKRKCKIIFLHVLIYPKCLNWIYQRYNLNSNFRKYACTFSYVSTFDVVLKWFYDIVIFFVANWIFKCNVGEVRKFTLIFNRLLEFKHISVKSREKNDEENPGNIEQQPFLDPNAENKSTGMYWSNVKTISNKTNIVFQTQFWSKTVKGNIIFEFIYCYVTKRPCFV